MLAATKLAGVAAVLLIVCDVAAAFAPGAAFLPTTRLGLRAGQPVSRRLSRPAVAKRLSMQEGGEPTEELKPLIPLYEDDSDALAAQKSKAQSSKQGGISKSMRDKLLKENQVPALVQISALVQITKSDAGDLSRAPAGALLDWSGNCSLNFGTSTCGCTASFRADALTRKNVHAGSWGRPRCSVRPLPAPPFPSQ